MTGTNGLDGTLTASFDGLTTSGDKYGSYYLPVYVTVQLPVPQALTQYSFTTVSWTSDRSPRTWKVMAGDDGVSWVLLDEVVGYTGFTTTYQTQTFTFTNTTAYRYYRIEVTEVKGNSLFGVSEINFPEFNGTTTTPFFPKKPFVQVSDNDMFVNRTTNFLRVSNTQIELSAAVYNNETSAALTERGFVYGTSPEPTVSTGTKAVVSGTSIVYSTTITGLISGVKYYVRPFATNANGTGYGQEYGITTSVSDGIVTTSAPIKVTSMGAEMSVNVISNEGSAIAERGIVWSTSPDPTTVNGTKYVDGAVTTGTFTGMMTGLSPATLYYVRPYIVNGTTTLYGRQFAFYSAFVEKYDWKPGVVVESDISPESFRWDNVLYKAFNNNTGDHWNFDGNNANMQFNYVTPQIITSYVITPNITSYASRAPKDWTFAGSNDLQSWTTLDTRTGITNWVGTTAQTFSFTNSTAYKHYRINISSPQSGTITRIAEWNFTNPYVGVSTDNVSGFEANSGGSASAVKSFNIVANNISTNNVTLTAPAGFEISTSSTTGFGSSLTLTPSSGNVSTRLIYVRVAANQAAGSLSGNILVSNSLISNINIACSATVSRTQVEITSSQDLTGLDNSTADLVISGASTVLTVNATKSYNKITINDQATLDLSNQGALTVNELIVKAGKNSAAIVKATNPMSVSDKFELHKTVDNTKSYFVSFPTNVQVDDIYQLSGAGTLGALGTNWWIKYYDGASRVVNLGTQSNWKNITAGQTLEANKGYILKLATSLVGDYELAFPLDKQYVNSAETNKSLNVVAYGEGSVAANHVGWNLIGVPFLNKFSGASFPANFITFRNAAGTAYAQLAKNEVTYIAPYEAVFVQANETGVNATGTSLLFDVSGKQAVKRDAETVENGIVTIILTNANGSDKTTLLINEAAGIEYVVNQDLEKWLSTGTDVPQLYTQIDSVRFAYNSLKQSDINDVCLGVYTRSALMNNLSLQNYPEGYQVLLSDTKTGSTIDLTQNNYEFQSIQGVQSDRFKITVKPVGGVTTEVLPNEISGIIVRRNNSSIIISGAMGAYITISDVSGKLLHNHVASSSHVKLDQLKPGLYLVQVVRAGEIVKTKIIL